MARDRPSPYVKGKRFFIVARETVRRERWSAKAMARDRPSPYGEGGGFLPPRPRLARRPIASRPGGLSYRDASKPGVPINASLF